MTEYDQTIADRVQRFREAALPCLDDAYRLAFFLVQSRSDAENAVERCFRKALQSFDSRRGRAMKPWLLAIVRKICHADLDSQGQHETPMRLTDDIHELLGALPLQLREVIFLRECNGMSYREIAEVIGVSPGAVMSRLAQARAILSVRRSVSNGAMPGDAA
jgi:RNA polymerase sigma-70 factor, ECF subfamily